MLGIFILFIKPINEKYCRFYLLVLHVLCYIVMIGLLKVCLTESIDQTKYFLFISSICDNLCAILFIRCIIILVLSNDIAQSLFNK